MSTKKNTSLKSSLPIFLAFLCMGFGDAVGPFVGLAKSEFNLSNTFAQLIPFTGFLMFGLLSVPMGIYQDKKGKKFILMLGLVLALIGLVIPAYKGLSTYGNFLITILLLGAGATILQVAGNPIMRDVSPEGKYARNLSLGQFVKAIGSLTGPLIPVIAARWYGVSWEVIFPIYSAALILTIIILSFTKIEKKKVKTETPATFRSCFALLKNPFVLLMVAGIFVYVGAEVSMSSGIPLYLEAKFGIDIKTLGVAGSGFFFIAIMAGRFLGSVILNWIKAEIFLIITALVSVVAILGLFVDNQVIAVISIFVTGLGFANIFPLIFSITVDKIPDRANELSGLMVTAIVGGAFLPLLMGLIADVISVEWGFVIPLLAIVYVFIIAFRTIKFKH
ncbi:MAG: MFS transporter [Bacteroidales bacterium]|nr:MFS transporter [Bacteroidales bacterium]